MENKSENKSFNPTNPTKTDETTGASAARLSAPSDLNDQMKAGPKAEDEAARKAELRRRFLAIRRFESISKLLVQLRYEIAEFNKGGNPVEDAIITTTTDYSDDIVMFVGYRLWELIYREASRYFGQPIEVSTEKCVSAYNDEPFTRYAFTFNGITLISHKDD